MNYTVRVPASFRTGTSRLRHRLVSLATDRVVMAFCLVLAALAAVDVHESGAALAFALRALGDILPFLLLAVGLAALSRATGADRKVATAFAGSPGRAVVIASLAGALSPFCSCGVVPVIAGLLRARVPLAPVMAFWIASPIMDPEMFVLTAAGISTEFAVAKTVATILMGLLAGYSIHMLQGFRDFHSPLRDAVACTGCSSADDSGPVEWRFWRFAARRETFVYEFGSTFWFLAKWLLLAFLLESLMARHLPPEWIGRLLGSGAWYEIPLAASVGVPAYLNGYAAIPLISGLMNLGMNPGAALAFMTAGAVSSIPAAMAVSVLVTRPVFVAYLVLGLTGSVLTGVLYSVAL